MMGPTSIAVLGQILGVWCLALFAVATAPAPAPALDPRLETLPELPMGPFVRIDEQTILTVDSTESLISRDNGATWARKPLFEGDAYKVRPERALIRTDEGTIILAFLNENEEHWDWDESKSDTGLGVKLPTYVMRSTNDGNTWEAPRMLHEEWTGAIRDIIQTKDGRVIFTSMMLMHNPGRHAVVTYSSDDDGKSWLRSNVIDLGGVGHHGGVTESTLAARADGSVWMLLRTNWGKFWESISYDGGKFWRVHRPTDIDASSAPGLLKRLESGRLLLLWNRRLPEGATTYPLTGGDGQWSELPVSNHREELSVAFSEDDGHTWSQPTVIATLRDGWVSYPYLLEAAPGELWVTTMQGNLRARFLERDFVPSTTPANEDQADTSKE